MARSHISRRERVLAAVQENTAALLRQGAANPKWIHAGKISELLELDRTNVARELNALYKNGQLIKIYGKPTQYICRSTLAQFFPNVFFPSTLPKGARLQDYTEAPAQRPAPEGRSASPLEEQTGAGHTLRTAVQYASAALLYPARNLHILITGSHGVGKYQFARRMYDYAVAQGVLAADAPFITANCGDSASPSLFLGQLFGYSRDASPTGEKSRRGLVDRAGGGILCLRDVDKLAPQVRDALATLLEDNTYTRVGEPAVPRRANAIVIAISVKQTNTPAMVAMHQLFPVNIHIPDLDDWSLGEKAELLVQTFQREAARAGIRLHIRREIFAAFLSAAYPGNLGELEGTVRMACALALANCRNTVPRPGTVEVTGSCLPPPLLQNIRSDPQQELDLHALLGRLEYLSFGPEGFSTDRFSAGQFLETLRQAQNSGVLSAPPPRIAALLAQVNQLFFDRANYRPLPSKPLSPEVTAQVRQALAPYPALAALAGEPQSLAPLLHCLAAMEGRELPQLDGAADLQAALRSFCPGDSLAAEAIAACGLLSLRQGDLPYLAACLHQMHNTRPPVPVLLVLHGQGVAERVADYINRALDRVIVSGISYPPGMNFSALLDRAAGLAQELPHDGGILIATDMEPLTELHEHISRATGIPCRSISNISLPTLLVLCEKSLHGSSLYALAEEVPADAGGESAQAEYPFIARIVREVLAPSLTFLNPQKTVQILYPALRRVLTDLGITQTNEIAIRFIFHCSHMLERLIRGDVLRYDGLKSFVSQNLEVMNVLEREMRYPEEMFGVVIPSSELAYLAELLLPYRN